MTRDPAAGRTGSSAPTAMGVSRSVGCAMGRPNVGTAPTSSIASSSNAPRAISNAIMAFVYQVSIISTHLTHCL